MNKFNELHKEILNEMRGTNNDSLYDPEVLFVHYAYGKLNLKTGKAKNYDSLDEFERLWNDGDGACGVVILKSEPNEFSMKPYKEEYVMVLDEALLPKNEI